MKLISIILVFIGSSAFAANNAYDLKMDLSLNGKHVSSPQLIVNSGVTATINQKMSNSEEAFIEVVATEGSMNNHKGILMNFVVGVIDKNGQKIIKAKPQILAKENEKAQITVGDRNDKEMSLSVIAQKISL